MLTIYVRTAIQEQLATVGIVKDNGYVACARESEFRFRHLMSANRLFGQVFQRFLTLEIVLFACLRHWGVLALFDGIFSGSESPCVSAPSKNFVVILFLRDDNVSLTSAGTPRDRKSVV